MRSPSSITPSPKWWPRSTGNEPPGGVAGSVDAAPATVTTGRTSGSAVARFGKSVRAEQPGLAVPSAVGELGSGAFDRLPDDGLDMGGVDAERLADVDGPDFGAEVGFEVELAADVGPSGLAVLADHDEG